MNFSNVSILRLLQYVLYAIPKLIHRVPWVYATHLCPVKGMREESFYEPAIILCLENKFIFAIQVPITFAQLWAGEAARIFLVICLRYYTPFNWFHKIEKRKHKLLKKRFLFLSEVHAISVVAPWHTGVGFHDVADNINRLVPRLCLSEWPLFANRVMLGGCQQRTFICDTVSR